MNVHRYYVQLRNDGELEGYYVEAPGYDLAIGEAERTASKRGSESEIEIVTIECLSDMCSK